MRRAIVIAVAGASLAGCSSFPSSLSFDAFKSAPPSLQLQLESVPAGAEARTSLGPTCRTPCSVTVPAPETGFTVSYTLNKFLPTTVPVQVNRTGGDMFSTATVTADPNPIVAELQPAGPPPKAAVRKKMMKPRKPKPPKGTVAPAATPSPFPDTPAPAPSAPPPPAAPSR